jgi:COP9 signalosome complex subunit 1
MLQTLIEECVRKVYHDFGDFYYACGRLGDAMKNYMKTRDYCTTSKQKIHLRLIAIMISIELRQFQRINTHVTRAKEVMESLDTSEFTAFDTSLTKVKLCCADGLAYLFYQKYKEAADKVCLMLHHF